MGITKERRRELRCLPWRAMPGCMLQLPCSALASVTTATLGMNGWLGLVRQGLSPCKKRQASLGALTVCVSGGGAGVDKAHYTENAQAQNQLFLAARIPPVGWHAVLGVAFFLMPDESDTH
jgi:hypothetical protein